MEIEPMYGTCCPNCKNDSVEICGEGIDRPEWWGISTNSWNYMEIFYCPLCGHKLPSIEIVPDVKSGFSLT